MSGKWQPSGCCPHCLAMFDFNVANPPDGYEAAGECPNCGNGIRGEVRHAEREGRQMTSKRWPVAEREHKPWWYHALNWVCVALLAFCLAILVLWVVMQTGRAVEKVFAAPPCYSPNPALNTCKYMPNPYDAGPLLPTWEVPGGYGLPGGSPVQCVPTGFSSNAVCSPGTLPGSGY